MVIFHEKWCLMTNMIHLDLTFASLEPWPVPPGNWLTAEDPKSVGQGADPGAASCWWTKLYGPSFLPWKHVYTTYILWSNTSFFFWMRFWWSNDRIGMHWDLWWSSICVQFKHLLTIWCFNSLDGNMKWKLVQRTSKLQSLKSHQISPTEQIGWCI
jgi:hypothetical protein